MSRTSFVIRPSLLAHPRQQVDEQPADRDRGLVRDTHDLFVLHVLTEGVGERADAEHPQAERGRRQRFGHHRHADDRRAGGTQQAHLGRRLVRRSAHGRVDPDRRRDAERLRALERELAQGVVVDVGRADEGRHAVGVAPPPQRRHAHHVQVIAHEHDGAGGLVGHEAPHRRCEHDRVDAELAGESRQQRGHVHAVALVEVHASEERGDRHAGQMSHHEPARVSGHARGREAGQLGERERRAFLERVTERGPEPRSQHDGHPWLDVGDSADDGGCPARKIVARARQPFGLHEPVASSRKRFRRTIAWIGDGSTPCESPT
jgi:hypothetical protein